MSATATAACPYCGVGCLLDVTLNKAGKVASIRGNVAAQANQGKICPKGALLAETIDTPNRLLTPLLRIDDGGIFVSITWDEALDILASKMMEIRDTSGPDAMAFYGSGQLDTEACTPRASSLRAPCARTTRIQTAASAWPARWRDTGRALARMAPPRATTTLTWPTSSW